MTDHASSYDQAPLLNPVFVWKCAGIIVILAMLTLAISFAGRIVGNSIILAGHTEETTRHAIVIGNDTMILPANMIRFETQRTSGVQTAIDLYFTWPEMEGYSMARASVFNQSHSAGPLIFARVAQATMSRDMSGRFGPIYMRLVEGSALPGPAGLSAWRLKPGTGYAGELLFAETRDAEDRYVVRCLVDSRPSDAEFETFTGCQRDIAVGGDLSLTYRFSSDLLPHWKAIDDAVKARFEAALAEGARL